MKLTHTLIMTFFFLCTFGLVSCSDDEGDTNTELQPSTDKVEMEGEGGSIEISLNTKDFIIAGVVNKTNDNNQYINGKIYNVNGELIGDDEKLYLEGMGQLQTAWNGKSFSIIRNTPFGLKVIVDENFTASDFSFAIILQSSQNEQKEIIVQQKKSQGYIFDKIEYSLQKNATEAFGTYITQTQTIPSGASGKYSLYPYQYIDTRVVSYFRSSENGAFTWAGNDKIEVKVPSEVRNNVIYYDETKHPYTQSSYLKFGKISENAEAIIDIPAGKSEFHIKFKVQNQDFPYTLTLTNKGTGVKKEIKGTWTESSFVEDYEIVWVK